LILTLFIKADEKFNILFDKKAYEDSANEQISILKAKEERITNLLKSINETKDFEKEGAKS
jgi:hypothetical protein